MVIRPNVNKVLPEYLYMLLKSQSLIDELQHLAETRSGTFPQITFSSELSQMEINGNKHRGWSAGRGTPQALES